MTDKGFCHIRAGSHDEIEYARGYPCLFKYFNERGRDGGRFRRWLPDDRIAGNECGENFPGGNRDGEVPGSDEPDNSRWVPDSHAELVRHFHRRGIAEQTASFTAHEICHVDGFLHVTARFCDDFAHIAREQLRKFLFFLFEEVTDFEKYFPADWGRG